MEPLTPWPRIKQILQQALDLKPQARAEFVRSACGDDEELRRRVDSLLAKDSRAALLSARPAFAWMASELAADAPRLQSGQLLGRYRIERRIGAGGMGEVYEARDETLQRLVAVKIGPAALTDPDRVERFEQEALAISRLNHPNIITIHEVGHVEGLHFIVTERIEGETLRALLMDPQTGAPRQLEIAKALHVATSVASALRTAHAAKIVHRDIKPENIMIRSSDGVVKVLDFGIAKTDRAPAVAGEILGTVSYMSPEQQRGEDLDQRTDIFSLGVVLYEMLGGERPFTGATRTETSTVHLDQALPATNRLASLPKNLQRIIRKMLEPEREARYTSMSALLEDLAAFQERRTRKPVRVARAAALVMFAAAVTSGALSYTETWQERVLRDGHTAASRQAIFSPDGRIVVSCSEDGQVIVWDFARRQRLKTLMLLSHKLAFSPDGRRLATGGADGAVTVWDAHTWQRIKVLGDHRLEITALAFSPDQSLLLAATHTRTIVWRTRDWMKQYQWESGGFGTFIFFSNPKFVFGPNFNFTYDLEDGNRISTEPRHQQTWMTLSADGAQLAGVDADGYLSFYRAADASRWDRVELVARQRAHRDNGRSVAFSPDVKLVASAAEDILLWNASTHEKIARFEYPSIVWSIAFSPDGRWIISSHADGAVLVWDVAERERVASFNEHSGAVRSVAFAPDTRIIATGSEDRTVVLWDARFGRKVAVLAGHATRVTGVAFAELTGTLASTDFGSDVIVWDVDRRQPRVRFSSRYAGLCLAVSPDGRLLATTEGLFTSDGRRLIEFHPTARAKIKDYTLRPFVYGVSFSGDGRILATVTEGGLVMIWDTRALRLLDFKQVPKTSQISASLSPDGARMVTGDDEGAVRLWSVSPLREQAILGRHAARVKSVAFSPDGNTAASAGDDRVIALWDVDGGKLKTRIGTHTSPVYAVAFSADGRQLVSGEHDRSVRLYTRHRSVWGIPLQR